nr:craniofacial development protein 2-like [Tanacetum cinerariifolium]
MNIKSKSARSFVKFTCPLFYVVSSDILMWIEALASYGNLRSCHSGRGGICGSSETRSDKSAKEGNGYKLWYSGSQTARNRIGVILKASLKDKVVHVNRSSDGIRTLTLVIDGETVNVISAYAPQVGLNGEDKKTFWDSLDEVVREFPTNQRLFLRGHLNGHIGAATEGYLGVYGFSYRVINEEDSSILDFVTVRRIEALVVDGLRSREVIASLFCMYSLLALFSLPGVFFPLCVFGAFPALSSNRFGWRVRTRACGSVSLKFITVFKYCLMSLDLSLSFENEYVALTAAQLEYGGNAID